MLHEKTIASSLLAGKPKVKRHFFSLQKKMEVTKYHEKNPGMSLRAVAEKFVYGKTSVCGIIKKKDSLLPEFHQNSSGSRLITVSSRSSCILRCQ